MNTRQYYSKASNAKYFSVSQYKDFNKCEHMAMAKIKRKYKPESSTALLVGSYVHAFLDESMEVFKQKHPEIFKRDGELKSEYKQADAIIKRLQKDKFAMKYLKGAHEVVRTGEWLGAPWKIRMDVFHEGKAIIDLKVMRDFEPIYVAGQGRIPWVEAWGYDIQATVYQAIEGNNLPFGIIAVTKQSIPDIAAIEIPTYHIQAVKEIMAKKMPRFIAVKNGDETPKRCGKCEYCRMTKQLDGLVPYDELEGNDE